jgi:hypothetical protein
MKKKPTVASRRNFLFGLLAGTGAASVALAAGGSAMASTAQPEQPDEGPVLYRRTKEAERYYKTLYT